LIVKEFADEDRQQLLVVLDLNCEADFGEGKARAFEVSVRIAASLAYYADRGKIPFYLAGASPQWTLPMTALSWWSAMNYLARVNNEGQEPLADFLGRIKLPTASFVVVLITQPTEVTVKTLQRLQRAGQQILPIFITLNGDLPDQARSLKKAWAVSPADWAAALDRL
jgi:uncharacterized protein (DUF58 family)